MERSKRSYLALLALGAMCGNFAACAESEPTATSGTAGPVGVAVTKSVSDTGEPENVDEQLSFAKADLAGRLGVEVGAIEIETVRSVHWRSGATGCPMPGMTYTAAIVPGVLIMLRAGGKNYRYHAKRKGTPFYCPDDRAEAPVLGQGQESI